MDHKAGGAHSRVICACLFSDISPVVHGVVGDGDPEGLDLQELDEVRRLRLLAVPQQRLLELKTRLGHHLLR